MGDPACEGTCWERRGSCWQGAPVDVAVPCARGRVVERAVSVVSPCMSIRVCLVFCYHCVVLLYTYMLAAYVFLVFFAVYPPALTLPGSHLGVRSGCRSIHLCHPSFSSLGSLHACPSPLAILPRSVSPRPEPVKTGSTMLWLCRFVLVSIIFSAGMTHYLCMIT